MITECLASALARRERIVSFNLYTDDHEFAMMLVDAELADLERESYGTLAHRACQWLADRLWGGK